jgi:hypothetical protein
VIVQSQTKLEKFLEGDELKDTVVGLWKVVVEVFQKGGEVGEIRFESNLLPAHSQYHIAKMLTLAIELFEKTPEQYLPEKYKARENRLAISLAAIFRDLGQLKQFTHEQDLPQQAYYPNHGERGIDLVEQIFEIFFSPEGLSDINKEKLLRKIKVLIYGTKVAKDMVFDDNPNPTWEQIKISKEINSGSIVINGEAIEVGDEKQEYLSLMQLFAAADHGSYLLEPAKVVEVLGLWQEKMRLWRSDDGEISSYKPPNSRYFSLFYFLILHKDRSRFMVIYWNNWELIRFLKVGFRLIPFLRHKMGFWIRQNLLLILLFVLKVFLIPISYLNFIKNLKKVLKILELDWKLKMPLLNFLKIFNHFNHRKIFPD